MQFHHPQEVARSKKQALPDSGYLSNDGQSRSTEVLGRTFTAERTVFKDTRPPTASKAAVKITSYQTPLVLVEHTMELQYNVTAAEDENVALRERNAALEAKTVGYYDTIDKLEEDDLM
ncbi:hypothetical protein SLS61_000797 [Didymella pomorum]